MIDIHNHLLAGIDDGAPDIETAITLAKIAINDGITHMVCTPHIHFGRYDNTLESITTAKQEFEIALKEHHIDLKITTAAEVRFDAEIIPMAMNNTLPFLGEWQGNKVILLEFPHSDIPFAAENLTAWLLDNNIIPMIAHPERNKAILSNSSKLNLFIQQGCLLQVTAGSLAGRFGQAVQQEAQRLLQQDLITVLATDAHNEHYRPPILSEGLNAAIEIVGESKAQELVQQNPWLITQSQFDSEPCLSS